jgi:hypothetical protein
MGALLPVSWPQTWQEAAGPLDWKTRIEEISHP